MKRTLALTLSALLTLIMLTSILPATAEGQLEKDKALYYEMDKLLSSYNWVGYTYEEGALKRDYKNLSYVLFVSNGSYYMIRRYYDDQIMQAFLAWQGEDILQLYLFKSDGACEDTITGTKK